MSLGSKLQSVHSRVNTKLGTQDATITFRKITNTEGAEFGTSYTSSANSDVTLTSGVKVGRVKAYETQSGGTMQIGDLKLLIPGSMISDAQLEGSQILYGGQTYAIISKAPKEIYSGVVVNWEVIGRLTK